MLMRRMMRRRGMPQAAEMMTTGRILVVMMRI
jgi:hypothetical protein